MIIYELLDCEVHLLADQCNFQQWTEKRELCPSPHTCESAPNSSAIKLRKPKYDKKMFVKQWSNLMYVCNNKIHLHTCNFCFQF